ncbi:MAG: anti-sigma factor antagonist [Treponema sp.]|nr:anti-sigma factor antagonist [Treponema sp.]
MMTIYANKIDKSTVLLSLDGRLDAANAPLLERKINQWGDEITKLVLDFSKLSYISSMGLRVLLHAQKTMKEKKGRLIVQNICEAVREVFQITGFLQLMIEEEKLVIIRKDETDCVTLSLNGEIDAGNISSVSEALFKVKEEKTNKHISTVILNMENIHSLSPNAVKQLNHIIADTAWEERKLHIQNASEDIQAALKGQM